ncbi:hypothetical protein ACS0TY_015208 [Phlomoides rotata]
MAAATYDVAALAFKGKGAELNFLISASSLPVPASASRRDIQAAAASAAAAVGAAADAFGGVMEAEAVNCEFVDEDLIFDLPNVIAKMAQGMLMSPPRMGFVDDYTTGFDGSGVDDYCLWNYT